MLGVSVSPDETSRPFLRLLEERLSTRDSNGEEPLAFAVDAPVDTTGFWVLMDRCRVILGRFRTPEEAAISLASHIRSVESHPGTSVRFRTRSLRSDDGVTLLLPPIGETYALAERRLADLGFDVVDRLAVDLDSSGVVLPPVRTPGELPSTFARGHCGFETEPSPIVRVLLPSVPWSIRQAVDRAGAISQLGSTSIGADRQVTLSIAARVCSTAALDACDVTDSDSIYRVLGGRP